MREQMVFSEGLPWPDAETELQYSSARKFFLVGTLPRQDEIAAGCCAPLVCVRMWAHLRWRLFGLARDVFRFSPARGGLPDFCSGDTSDAAANLASLRRKLQRGLHGSRISPGVWAQLEAVVLTREAELALWHSREGNKERTGRLFPAPPSLLLLVNQVPAERGSGWCGSKSSGSRVILT